MRAPPISLFLLGMVLLPPVAWALPPVETPAQALQQLSLEPEEARRAALANLRTACRGRHRHALKDHVQVVQAVEKLLRDGSVSVQKASLDTVRCFSGPHPERLLGLGLASAELAVQSYAAEIAAQIPEPPITRLLLQRLSAAKADCADPEASPERVERCVWLVYSAGATVGTGHDRALRAEIGGAIEPALESPHAKVREVAVETLAKTRLKAHGAAILRLVEKEKKGGFAARNEAALLTRFKERAKDLGRKGE